MKHKYKCTRCGIKFEIKHEVDRKSALCTPCFKGLLNVKSYSEYKSYLNK